MKKNKINLKFSIDKRRQHIGTKTITVLAPPREKRNTKINAII